MPDPLSNWSTGVAKKRKILKRTVTIESKLDWVNSDHLQNNCFDPILFHCLKIEMNKRRIRSICHLPKIIGLNKCHASKIQSGVFPSLFLNHNYYNTSFGSKSKSLAISNLLTKFQSEGVN
jgi:hypothetical protein